MSPTFDQKVIAIVFVCLSVPMMLLVGLAGHEWLAGVVGCIGAWAFVAGFWGFCDWFVNRS